MDGFVCDMNTLANNNAQTYVKKYQKNKVKVNISIFIKSLTPIDICNILKNSKRLYFEGDVNCGTLRLA